MYVNQRFINYDEVVAIKDKKKKMRKKNISVDI